MECAYPRPLFDIRTLTRLSNSGNIEVHTQQVIEKRLTQIGSGPAADPSGLAHYNLSISLKPKEGANPQPFVNCWSRARPNRSNSSINCRSSSRAISDSITSSATANCSR